jgi:hypothetical protein
VIIINFSVITTVREIMVNNNDASIHAISFAVTAAWELDDYASLETFLMRSTSDSFEITLGRLLLSIHNNDMASVDSLLNKSRSLLTQQLTSASVDSYQRAYEISFRLSLLHDIESFCKVLASPKDRSMELLHDLVSLWDAKLPVLVPSIKIREPILVLRHALLRYSGLKIAFTIPNT